MEPMQLLRDYEDRTTPLDSMTFEQTQQLENEYERLGYQVPDEIIRINNERTIAKSEESSLNAKLKQDEETRQRRAAYQKQKEENEAYHQKLAAERAKETEASRSQEPIYKKRERLARAAQADLERRNQFAVEEYTNKVKPYKKKAKRAGIVAGIFLVIFICMLVLTILRQIPLAAGISITVVSVVAAILAWIAHKGYKSNIKHTHLRVPESNLDLY